jgi:hypothetical protein
MKKSYEKSSLSPLFSGPPSLNSFSEGIDGATAGAPTLYDYNNISP